MRSQPQTSPASSPIPGSRDTAPTPVVESTALLQGRPEVVILHNGREYRLRHTRLGKLILTA
jgi:hemin uptake protein HemP